MKLCMKGELFFVEGQKAPLFEIETDGLHFYAHVLSPFSNKEFAGGKFSTLGKASEWCYGYREY